MRLGQPKLRAVTGAGAALLVLTATLLFWQGPSSAQSLADPTLRTFRLGQTCVEAVAAARALSANGDGLKGSQVNACQPIPDTVGRFHGVTLQRFVPEELKDFVAVSMDDTNTVESVRSQTYWFQPPGAPELPMPSQMREQLAQKYGAPDIQATWQSADGVVFAYIFGQPQLRLEDPSKWLGQEEFEAALRQARGSVLSAEIEAFTNSRNVRGVSQLLNLRKVPAIPRAVKL